MSTSVASEFWTISHRADKRALPLADRHYNRQKIGSPQFLPPGRCFALITADATALWATSFPFAQYVKHAWAGAWMNSLFRNERRDLHLSSDLIREAVAVTRWYHADNAKWNVEPEPALGMVTFVDADKTKAKRDPGRCYRRAGFKHVGFTKAGLWVFQMLPAEMPEAQPPATPFACEDFEL
jgi:hypothetical protein